MPRQVPFTEYEAALLLDAYLKTLSGEKGRMESVRDCSMQLRQMALNAGSEIDDICRNVNGISFQMASMESAYQGHTIMKPATRLFTEIVLLYRNDVARYQQLLKEAKGMASAKIDMDQSDAATTVSFRHINSMAFSKPVSLSYFGEVKPESSWKGLYVDACKSLLDDYPDIFTRLKAESLHGSGKTWLVDAENLHLLAVPKQLEEGLFVETNRNAFDLVKNLKWLLDECSVDYENVVITYTNKDGKKEASVPAPVTTSAFQKKQYYRQDKEDFYRWLQNDQHMAEGTCRSYVSAIRSAEHFAEEHGLASRKLYTCDPTVAKATADELFSNAEFIQYNNDQHNRFRAAITKLLAFYGSNWSPVEASTPRTFERSPLQTKETSIDVAPCKAILVEYFPKGYRLESALDMKRMRRYYEELTGKALDLNQAILETAIRNCGIVYDGRLYMPQNMLSDEMRDQILFFIERCFDEGRSAVYYEAVFREFSEKLLDHNIFNADMLKAYLTYYVSDQYYMGRSYLAKEYRDDVDPIDEVWQCLKQYDFPVQVDELCDSLSHITEERIRFILGSNGEFVRNSKGEYFHADSLELTKEELENIAAIIDSTIEEHEFISGNELYDAIQTKYPYTFEKNAVFSVIGWRDALKYKFGDRFSFVGNIVSRAGTSLSMSDVFAEYGKGRQRFSIDELEQFAESIGTTIYFDSLYTNAIRISHEWFTSKGGAKFSVKETDAVLDRFCDGDYIPLQDVKEFALFPESSFPWTEYLLEQYVAFFSEKFYLMHGNYNKNCAVGAIVRKTCRFDSFDDLVTDILAHNDVSLQKKKVLDYLAENGYIARRSYTNIETIMINARAMRNQKEK
ncbi:hypothetical protein KFE16_14100 [Clostridiaceae bacterium Marseille-Q4149]|nr:hypothetical protein KFE16_14100 [Clostridiaceae bacterium Marseille-Q4149]